MKRVAMVVSGFLLCLPLVTKAALVPYACEDPNFCGTCEFVKVINNIIQFVVQISTLLAVAAFIYAGFLMVTSQGNEGQISKAKGIFTNVVIGFVILLAAFIIVNTILAGLLKTGSPVYQWQTIECVYPDAPSGLKYNAYSNDPVAVIGAGMPGSGYGGATPGSRGYAQCATDNTNCSVEYLQSLGLTSTQANVMSCIAITENSGGSVGCSGTGPCGTFQISRTDWRERTEGPGGVTGCSAADFGGNITAAQNNASCNAQVMARMVTSSRGYQPWTGANNGVAWNPNARSCVNNYGSGSDVTNRGF